MTNADRPQDRTARWVRAGKSTALPFTSLPAYCAMPFLILLFHMRLSTLAFALVFTAVIWFMSSKGRTLPWMIGRVRGWCRNNVMYARPIWHIRRTTRITAPGESYLFER